VLRLFGEPEKRRREPGPWGRLFVLRAPEKFPNDTGSKTTHTRLTTTCGCFVHQISKRLVVRFIRLDASVRGDAPSAKRFGDVIYVISKDITYFLITRIVRKPVRRQTTNGTQT
jgi:hypothetical protein|tara:strand:- start:11248 stop:11589 length:342 start_codon:yes stop_codon:yes gene_type:complete